MTEDNWADHPELLRSPVVWSRATKNDDYVFYVGTASHRTWQLRLNDFPEEPLFTLLIGGQEVIHFTEWPAEWGPSPRP